MLVNRAGRWDSGQGACLVRVSLPGDGASRGASAPWVSCCQRTKQARAHFWGENACACICSSHPFCPGRRGPRLCSLRHPWGCPGLEGCREGGSEGKGRRLCFLGIVFNLCITAILKKLLLYVCDIKYNSANIQIVTKSVGEVDISFHEPTGSHFLL